MKARQEIPGIRAKEQAEAFDENELLSIIQLCADSREEEESID